MNIIIAILIFSVLIIIHELGHFLLAKSNGIFVTEFSIGMGPRILSMVKTTKGYRLRAFMSPGDFAAANRELEATIYSIKLLPIGGSCMMLGEDESVEDERAFNKKGVWGRISVVLAGPIFNFVLALVLALVIVGMRGYDPAKVTNVTSQAKEAGLQNGDVITQINGKHINLARELDLYLFFNPLNEADVELTYERGGEKHNVTINPEYVKDYKLGFYYDDGNGTIVKEVMDSYPMKEAGLQKGDIITEINGTVVETKDDIVDYFKQNPMTEKAIEIVYKRDGTVNTASVTPKLAGEGYTIGFGIDGSRVKTNGIGVIKYSLAEVKYVIVYTVDSLKMLFTGKVKANDLAGPVGIVDMIGNIYKDSAPSGFVTIFLSLASFSLLLSANLGIMNLLPIPALDGGRLVFLLIEVFRGRPVDQNKEGIVHMIGFIALMILMVFVMFNDLNRIF
ncbi:RIP metalloprotease RseP [Anaerocolumna xylanovorans]|uniref:Zinc metalloprotease n=1 Tax=Anaerocolumna xylanovorans DSM 12503 TaxID=1121345 RepID=A0A1M7YC99_9FIRM|nr:RIP metalloprotease RseP [Anaerocolumna xylanovorans]SHO50264.1 regulator of sigma E protease [Anaerocolumna xylanovorans DSM 12503]